MAETPRTPGEAAADAAAGSHAVAPAAAPGHTGTAEHTAPKHAGAVEHLEAAHAHGPAAGSLEAANAPGRTHLGHSLRAALIGMLAVSVILLAFIWPSITTSTKHLPVVMVAPTAAQAAEHEKALNEKAGTMDAGFEFTRASTRTEAEQLLKERKAYAAYIYTAEGSELLTATAASPVAAQMAGGVYRLMAQDAQKSFAQNQQSGAQEAAKLGAQAAAAGAAAKTLAGVAEKMAGLPGASALQPRVAEAASAAQTAADKAQAAKDKLTSAKAPGITISEVAGLNSKDPRGTNLALAGMPLTMGGMVGGILVSLLLRGTRSRLAGVVLYGALAGLAIVLIMHTWFGVLQGNFLAEWAAASISLAATAALISGLQALIGQPGIGLGAVITMFVANPISSITTPKEFLPGPWGEIGQMFVPGATGTLLRDLSYFPQADMTTPWIVLVAWLVAGIAISLAAAAKARKTA